MASCSPWRSASPSMICLRSERACLRMPTIATLSRACCRVDVRSAPNSSLRSSGHSRESPEKTTSASCGSSLSTVLRMCTSTSTRCSSATVATPHWYDVGRGAQRWRQRAARQCCREGGYRSSFAAWTRRRRCFASSLRAAFCTVITKSERGRCAGAEGPMLRT